MQWALSIQSFFALLQHSGIVQVDNFNNTAMTFLLILTQLLVPVAAVSRLMVRIRNRVWVAFLERRNMIVPPWQHVEVALRSWRLVLTPKGVIDEVAERVQFVKPTSWQKWKRARGSVVGGMTATAALPAVAAAARRSSGYDFTGLMSPVSGLGSPVSVVGFESPLPVASPSPARPSPDVTGHGTVVLTDEYDDDDDDDEVFAAAQQQRLQQQLQLQDELTHGV